ncbi:MAG: hypothetical protein WD598_01315 [Acidimicrobiia bacterium]
MFAYLDAGSGSVLIAALAGGLAGIAILVKMFWHRILGVLSPRHRAAAAAAKAELVDDAEH